MAYNNTINLVTKYLPLLDEVYKKESVTAILDAGGELVRTEGLEANEVKVAKIALQGLGTYLRNKGFADGDVSVGWETIQLTADRGRGFQIDAMDNQESLILLFINVISEFIRVYVVPEIDAYRFSRYASKSGIGSATGEYTADTVLGAIDLAAQEMSDAEVPEEGRVLFLSNNIYALIKDSPRFSRRILPGESPDRNFEMLDDMIIKRVPRGRFFTKVTLLDAITPGQEAGGYLKDNDASDINFAIIHPSAVLQIVKREKARIFAPDVNQEADAFKYQYRIYHDAYVYDNKVNGIFISKRTNQTVTFLVKDDADTPAVVKGATVVVDGRTYTTGADGKAEVLLPKGKWKYTVSKVGSVAVSDEVTVASQAVTENVTLATETI